MAIISDSALDLLVDVRMEIWCMKTYAIYTYVLKNYFTQ